MLQEQSTQTQLAHWSPPQLAHWHVAWLQVGQVQSVQVQTAQLSLQSAHEQVVHSS